MAIPTTPITGAQFDILQNNISAQGDLFPAISDIAESGLNYVVIIDETIPELDLLTPFFNQYNTMTTFDTTGNFTQVVTALNQHVISRGTTALPGETSSDRLNRWLLDNGFGPGGGDRKITATYARLSSGAGYIIDPTIVV